MKVVRIEHPVSGEGFMSAVQGIGCPYKNFSFSQELLKKFSKFPVPHIDRIRFDENHFCAFKSINQMKYWIPKKWIKEMIDYGFCVYELELSNYQEGEKQVCFKKKSIINKNDITNLFTI